MSTLSPPSPPASARVPPPDCIEVGPDRTQLWLAWPMQPPVVVAAGALRAACKCAHCTRARFDGRFPADFGGIAIAEVSPMGNFGINIAFSDGHARGIYPWTYLRELAPSFGAPDDA